MAPIDISATLGHVWLNVFYVLTGIGFGFALERAGFGNSNNLAAQFYLKDMRVLKVMFTAIMTAMLLIFWADALGLLSYSQLYINPAYLGSGILGGLIFGMGFVVGGYCPGTALVSMATFKLDGLFFVMGLVAGMTVFGETVDRFRVFYDTNGYLGVVTLPEILHLRQGAVVLGVVLLALGMFRAAEKIEQHFRGMQKGSSQ